jgi:hypothetical protein
VYRAKLANKRFASSDTFQKLYADRFLHRKVYAKFHESCSRSSVTTCTSVPEM